MTYRALGNSGLMVSAIGLGCNNFGRKQTATYTQEGTTAVIHAALDAGITLFDTADIYGAEPGLSETLMAHAIEGRRDELVLATKFGMSMDGANGPDWGARGSRRYIRTAVEASLRRLRTEWIDLYQFHEPDPHTPIEETLATLSDLIAEGKVRYIGHSNLSGWQIVDAHRAAQIAAHPAFVSAQNEYSLLRRDAESEVLPAVRHCGLGFLPYFPLHNGLLTGKYSADTRPADGRITTQKAAILETAPWDAIEAYRKFCQARDITMVQATFSWLLAQPALASVIAGATTPEQVRANAATAQGWDPSADELDEISTIFQA